MIVPSAGPNYRTLSVQELVSHPPIRRKLRPQNQSGKSRSHEIPLIDVRSSTLMKMRTIRVITLGIMAHTC